MHARDTTDTTFCLLACLPLGSLRRVDATREKASVDIKSKRRGKVTRILHVKPTPVTFKRPLFKVQVRITNYPLPTTFLHLATLVLISHQPRPSLLFSSLYLCWHQSTYLPRIPCLPPDTPIRTLSSPNLPDQPTNQSVKLLASRPCSHHHLHSAGQLTADLVVLTQVQRLTDFLFSLPFPWSCSQIDLDQIISKPVTR